MYLYCIPLDAVTACGPVCVCDHAVSPICVIGGFGAGQSRPAVGRQGREGIEEPREGKGGSERPTSMKRDLPISHARWRQSQVPLAGDGAARAQKKDPRCLFQVRTGRARLRREIGRGQGRSGCRCEM